MEDEACTAGMAKSACWHVAYAIIACQSEEQLRFHNPVFVEK
jgi:hypothetical protein